MLYSPTLSFIRIIPLVLWTLCLSLMHIIFHFIFKKSFFLFYNLFFKGLVKLFGIKVNSEGFPIKKNVLFISNHISYLDIFILGSLVEGLFVAKSEINTWPVINKICVLGRTLFVDRKNLVRVKGQMNMLVQTLKRGFSIILFPEGTSSDGSRVLPFKSSLFGVIENQKQKRFLLQPISISYSKLDGLPIETNFRPFFAWFGNMDLVSHFWKFLGLGLSEVKVKFHKPIKFCDFKDRKHAANHSHEIISSQISKDLQTVEVEKKIRLNEFKLL